VGISGFLGNLGIFWELTWDKDAWDFYKMASLEVSVCESVKKMETKAKKRKKKGLSKSFTHQRMQIHNDIEQFLLEVLYFCVDYMEKQIKTDKWEIDEKEVATKISKNLESLIKSLCLIHGLYGYPSSNKTGKS
jgi:hypothetical protein